MKLEVRIKIPGTASWVVTSLDEVWGTWKNLASRFQVETQAEANILIGYSLVYGKVPVEVAELVPTSLNSKDMTIWLQLVNVSPLV